MKLSLGQLLAVILACLTLAPQCNGAAIPLDGFNNRTANALSRRQCEYDHPSGDYNCNFNLPSLNQIVAHMHDRVDGGIVTKSARAVFHTNLYDPYGPDRMYRWIIGWLLANGVTDWYMDFNAASKAWTNTQQSWINKHPDEMQPKLAGWSATSIFGGCYSQALGAAAIYEDAYIFTPHDMFWGAESTWSKIELPALTAEVGTVQRIYKVDPRPPEVGGLPCPKAAVVWEKRFGPVEPDATVMHPFSCPVTIDG